MTALDHLRAVLAATNDKAYRTAEDQDVIEQAKRFVGMPEETLIPWIDNLGNFLYQAAFLYSYADYGEEAIEYFVGRRAYGPMTVTQDGVTRVFQRVYPTQVSPMGPIDLRYLQKG